MPFRTTISAVLWTDTVEEAQKQAEAVRAAVVDDAQDQVLATIEYHDQRPPDLVPVGNGQPE